MWEKSRAEYERPVNKIMVLLVVASISVGVATATALTRRGVGAAASLKLWAMSALCACVTMFAMFPWTFGCGMSPRPNTVNFCTVVWLVGFSAIAGAGGMTIGTVARLALVASGR